MNVLGKFGVIMADPPWEIHQDLPYGTMADDEMRKMNIKVLQDDGVIFLWVTGAHVSVCVCARACVFCAVSEVSSFQALVIHSPLPTQDFIQPPSQCYKYLTLGDAVFDMFNKLVAWYCRHVAQLHNAQAVKTLRVRSCSDLPGLKCLPPSASCCCCSYLFAAADHL